MLLPCVFDLVVYLLYWLGLLTAPAWPLKLLIVIVMSHWKAVKLSSPITDAGVSASTWPSFLHSFVTALCLFENQIPLPTTCVPRPTTVNATIWMWRQGNCEAVETMSVRVVTAGFSFLFNYLSKYDSDFFYTFWQSVVCVQCASSWSSQHFHITAHRGATDFPGSRVLVSSQAAQWYSLHRWTFLSSLWWLESLLSVDVLQCI